MKFEDLKRQVPENVALTLQLLLNLARSANPLGAGNAGKLNKGWGFLVLAALICSVVLFMVAVSYADPSEVFRWLADTAKPFLSPLDLRFFSGLAAIILSCTLVLWSGSFALARLVERKPTPYSFKGTVDPFPWIILSCTAACCLFSTVNPMLVSAAIALSFSWHLYFNAWHVFWSVTVLMIVVSSYWVTMRLRKAAVRRRSTRILIAATVSAYSLLLPLLASALASEFLIKASSARYEPVLQSRRQPVVAELQLCDFAGTSDSIRCAVSLLPANGQDYQLIGPWESGVFEPRNGVAIFDKAGKWAVVGQPERQFPVVTLEAGKEQTLELTAGIGDACLLLKKIEHLYSGQNLSDAAFNFTVPGHVNGMIGNGASPQRVAVGQVSVLDTLLRGKCTRSNP